MASKINVVTIGREYGSGGHEIGEKLAQSLGYRFYDSEILIRAAKDSGICEELFRENDEKTTPSYLYSLVSGSTGIPGAFMLDIPLNQRIFIAQFEAITKLSKESPCIIVGRCADYVLRERKDVLNVFLYASVEERIKRIIRVKGVTEEKAREDVKKIDKQRQSYYNYFADYDWGDHHHYDLMMRTDGISTDECARLILDFLNARQA